MVEEIDFENGWISNFKGLVTLTLTLDRVRLHTVVHHSSTSTYTPDFIEIEKTLCGRTDGRTFETGYIRWTLSKSRPKMVIHNVIQKLLLNLKEFAVLTNHTAITKIILQKNKNGDGHMKDIPLQMT